MKYYEFMQKLVEIKKILEEYRERFLAAPKTAEIFRQTHIIFSIFEFISRHPNNIMKLNPDEVIQLKLSPTIFSTLIDEDLIEGDKSDDKINVRNFINYLIQILDKLNPLLEKVADTPIFQNNAAFSKKWHELRETEQKKILETFLNKNALIESLLFNAKNYWKRIDSLASGYYYLKHDQYIGSQTKKVLQFYFSYYYKAELPQISIDATKIRVTKEFYDQYIYPIINFKSMVTKQASKKVAYTGHSEDDKERQESDDQISEILKNAALVCKMPPYQEMSSLRFALKLENIFLLKLLVADCIDRIQEVNELKSQLLDFGIQKKDIELIDRIFSSGIPLGFLKEDWPGLFKKALDTYDKTFAKEFISLLHKKQQVLRIGNIFEYKDKNGDTLLHWAAKKADDEMMDHLTTLGADPKIPNKDNLTPDEVRQQQKKSFLEKIASLLSKGGENEKESKEKFETRLDTLAQRKNEFLKLRPDLEVEWKMYLDLIMSQDSAYRQKGEDAILLASSKLIDLKWKNNVPISDQEEAELNANKTINLMVPIVFLADERQVLLSGVFFNDFELLKEAFPKIEQYDVGGAFISYNNEFRGIWRFSIPENEIEPILDSLEKNHMVTQYHLHEMRINLEKARIPFDGLHQFLQARILSPQNREMVLNLMKANRDFLYTLEDILKNRILRKNIRTSLEQLLSQYKSILSKGEEGDVSEEVKVNAEAGSTMVRILINLNSDLYLVQNLSKKWCAESKEFSSLIVKLQSYARRGIAENLVIRQIEPGSALLFDNIHHRKKQRFDQVMHGKNKKLAFHS